MIKKDQSEVIRELQERLCWEQYEKERLYQSLKKQKQGGEQDVQPKTYSKTM